MAKCEFCEKTMSTGNKISIARSHVSRRSLRTFKDEIISGITIKDIIITIKTTKTIDRLIAKTSFILLFFFKYFSIGSKRMAIKIAIIKVIKYPVHLPIIVEKLSGFVKYDCNITKIKIIPVIFIIFFKFI